MTNTTVQRRERAADRKAAAATSNKHVNYRECSLLLASQPSGEDKTRVGLKAVLADTKSKHLVAEQEVQSRQTPCIKICEVIDRAERKLAANYSTRLGTQDFHTGSFKAKGKGGQCASREAFETSLTVDTHHQTSGVVTGGHAEGA